MALFLSVTLRYSGGPGLGNWETQILESRRMNREKSRKFYSDAELCRQDLLLFLSSAPVPKSLSMDWRQKYEKEETDSSIPVLTSC